MKSFGMRLLMCAVVCGTVCSAAFASTITWSTWTGTSGNATIGYTATGTLLVGTTLVDITYTSTTDEPNGFSQYNCPSTCYDYYQSPGTGNPTYVNSTVSNAPTGGNMLAIFDDNSVHTITFSVAINNPIMSFVSLGAGGTNTQYQFSNSPTISILSQGPGDAYGGCDTCLSISGETLIGNEGDGDVQFTGNYTSITWTGAGGESWDGFTFGVTGLATTTTTPEPPTIELMGLALLAGGAFIARMAKANAS